MKVTIDTKNKTVSITKPVSISELILFLQESLKDWESYSLHLNSGYPYYPSYFDVNNIPLVKDISKYR